MKPFLAGLVVFVVATQSPAEYRTVLIQITHDKENKASVAIHSDEKNEQKSAVSLDDSVKLLCDIKGSGSQVGVYVIPDRAVPRAGLKKLLAAINDNPSLTLEYFGHDVPKEVAEHFLKITPDDEAADVRLIANWLCGNDPDKAFVDPFGDRSYLVESKEPLLYTDIPGVKPPSGLKVVNYELAQARMQRIKNGHKTSPVVLIVRASLDEPDEHEIQRTKDEPAGRVYYVEVAIGNLAWHKLKVSVRQENNTPKARIVWHKQS
jgi:hypothetical protein